MFDFLKRSQLVRRGLASRKKRAAAASRTNCSAASNTRPTCKVVDLRGFRRRTRVSDLQRPTTGADEEFRHRAALFRDRADAALDQSAEDLSAELAAPSGLRHHLRAARRDQACSRALQQRHLRFPPTGDGGLIAPYAFAPLVLSVLLGRNHGLYAAVFVSLWSSILFGKIDAPLLVCGLISGFTAVYLTLQVRRRSRLIRAGFGVGVAIWFSSLTFGLIGPIDLFFAERRTIGK